MSDYLQFLRSKIVTAPSSGFRVDPAEINPALKAAIVRCFVKTFGKEG